MIRFSRENTLQAPNALGVIPMIGLGFLVGLIGGFGAILFRMMISFFHYLLFFGKFYLFYNANVHTPSSVWGVWVIFVPVVGALGVAWLVQTFCPEAKGHGVPEVIDAIYFNRGKIRPLVAVIKSIASALSIGSGGSVGREGPIIQIGSAFGSTLGQIFRMPARQRITLIAAGAGAGIAATFNAPIGGMAFAVELLLVSVNAGTIAVVTIATMTATYVGRMFLGMHPSFNIPQLALPTYQLTDIKELVFFLPFGILIGLASALFIHSIYWFEDKFEALPFNYYLRHSLGMLVLGLMLYGFIRFTGHYYVQGVGYATIVDVLTDMIKHPWFLLLLFFAKLLATSLTLGSGSSGGVFSPGLFMGATFGAFFGDVVGMIFPHTGFSPTLFAVSGMAGMVSGTTGAVLTAITILFEMTRDYNAILPIVLTVAIAYITRSIVSKESIYTLKLLRRGHTVHEGLQAAIPASRDASHLMRKDYKVISVKTFADNIDLIRELHVSSTPIVIEEEGKILGLLKEGSESYNMDQALNRNFIFVTPRTKLLDMQRRMSNKNSHISMVLKDARSNTIDNLIGVITSQEISKFTNYVAELMD